MKKLYFIFTLFTVILFTACGGGGGTGAIGKNESITGYLIDSYITGARYDFEYDDESYYSLTDENGAFYAVGSTPITFSVGGIKLGTIEINEHDKLVTPSDLYNLSYSNFTDIRLLNFIRLMQSIDNDLDPDTDGIVISTSTRAKLNNISLDISNPNTTSEELEEALESEGISLVTAETALLHYKSTLTTNFSLYYDSLDSEDPIITSDSIVNVNENQTYVTTITATDNSIVTYTISGTDSDSFTINSVSGRLIFNESPDYETKNSYTITVGARDTSYNSSSQTLTININDLDEDSTYLSEPYFSQQWALAKNDTYYTNYNIDDDAHINPGTVYDNYTGNGITIAIIDNGFDSSHEDLADAVEDTYSLATGTSNVSHDSSDEYHGTAVAGISAARINGLGIAGIASNANLVLIKYDSNGMTDSEFIELFDKAEELDADVINCSWGTGDVSDAVKEKIQDLAENGRNGKGISIVFAAGNDDEDIDGDESDIEEVISVGATSKYNLRTYYSNHGDNLDIVAPGGAYLGITTTDVSGSDGGSSFDENYLQADDGFIGTSAAAPIVTGIIALMLEKDPTLTRKEIEEILKESADKIGEEEYISGRNDYYGYGKVNLTTIMSNID